MNRGFLLSALIALTALNGPVLRADGNPEILRSQMFSNVEFIQNIFEFGYAPRLWKSEQFEWVLSDEVQSAREQIESMESLSVREYQTILRKFLESTRDYHVSVRFHSTEKSSLPFQVMGVGERYFLVHIDREKLPMSAFPFSVGDEVVEFGGQSTHEAVMEIKDDFMDASPLTDKALAELRLTSRSRSRAMEVPRGPITVGIQKRGSTDTTQVQLIWEHVSERIKGRHKTFEKQSETSLIPKLEMTSPIAQEFMEEAASENRFAIGAKRSFIPRLGLVVWESDKEDLFDAYIYRNAEGRLIGYVRIPSYSAGTPESLAFAELMNQMNLLTDALVIDQINNPGGSVFYLYSLVSMLVGDSAFTPRHRMAINQAEIAQAVQALEELREVDSDEAAKKALGPFVSGYPVDHQFVQFAREYFEFFVQQWTAGNNLTEPFHIFGVDRINPSRRAQYTKPILLLVNHLDFSGGDFFPAILQDNERVTILGTRTAGAGGYIARLEYPNRFGVQGIVYTGSIAERLDQNPIENLGVTPDIEHELTVEDVQGGFRDYMRMINRSVSELLQ